MVTASSLAGSAWEQPAAAAPSAKTVLATTGSGPASKYDCNLTIRPADAAYTGADGTASEIGWEGNHQGVVTCLGGVFYIQDVLDKNLAIGFGTNYGFGIYHGGPTPTATFPRRPRRLGTTVPRSRSPNSATR
jgi:hypothetical protein